jgi:hypothetical protein
MGRREEEEGKEKKRKEKASHRPPKKKVIKILEKSSKKTENVNVKRQHDTRRRSPTTPPKWKIEIEAGWRTIDPARRSAPHTAGLHGATSERGHRSHRLLSLVTKNK